MRKIRSKLTVKAPERRQFYTLFWCFHFKLKCWLDRAHRTLVTLNSKRTSLKSNFPNELGVVYYMYVNTKVLMIRVV